MCSQTFYRSTFGYDAPFLYVFVELTYEATTTYGKLHPTVCINKTNYSLYLTSFEQRFYSNVDKPQWHPSRSTCHPTSLCSIELVSSTASELCDFLQ